jgi:hypothetical protein
LRHAATVHGEPHLNERLLTEQLLAICHLPGFAMTKAKLGFAEVLNLNYGEMLEL